MSRRSPTASTDYGERVLALALAAALLVPKPHVVALRVRAQQRDGVRGPVRREDVAAAECGCERRQAETRAELEDPEAGQVPLADETGKCDAARPELGPVRQELVLVERRFVYQLVGARRARERHLPACELECLVDQRAA